MYLRDVAVMAYSKTNNSRLLERSGLCKGCMGYKKRF